MKARMIVVATVAGVVVCGTAGVIIGRAGTAATATSSVSSTVSSRPTPSATTVLDAGGQASRPSASATWVDTRPVGSATASVPVVTVTAGAGTPRGGIPDPAGVDHSDPTAVASAFARTLLTMDARIDGSPTVAAVRAGVYATPALAAQLGQAPVGSSGADWTSLVAQSGFTVCDTSTASLGERPADTATAAVRGISANVTGFSGNGQRMWVREHVVLVSMSRDGAAWVVSAWQYAN